MVTAGVSSPNSSATTHPSLFNSFPLPPPADARASSPLSPPAHFTPPHPLLLWHAASCLGNQLFRLPWFQREVAVCADTVIVSRVSSCHPAPSQSCGATPEAAEDHDTANQAPAAPCCFCRNCISHRDVNRSARQATALLTWPTVTIRSQDAARGTYVFVCLSVQKGQITLWAERVENSGTTERGGEERRDTGKEKSRGMRSTQSQTWQRLREILKLAQSFPSGRFPVTWGGCTCSTS